MSLISNGHQNNNGSTNPTATSSDHSGAPKAAMSQQARRSGHNSQMPHQQTQSNPTTTTLVSVNIIDFKQPIGLAVATAASGTRRQRKAISRQGPTNKGFPVTNAVAKKPSPIELSLSSSRLVLAEYGANNPSSQNQRQTVDELWWPAVINATNAMYWDLGMGNTGFQQIPYFSH